MDLDALAGFIRQVTFHPAFVHFPITLYFLEMGLLVGWVTQGDQSYHYFSELAFELGYKFMLLTMLTGFVAAGGFAGLVGDVGRHFYYAVALFFFYSARRFYAKKADLHASYYPWIQLSGAVVGCLLLTWVAFYGGKLIYLPEWVRA